jgi:hypothetical protein
MIASAIFLGICGIVLTFIPNEISEYLDFDFNKIAVLILQILGALYLGFALLNWMTKHNLIGGIYSRPLVIGNLLHFLVSSFALIKIALNPGNHSEIILILTIVYSIFTLCFAYVFMTNPNKPNIVK